MKPFIVLIETRCKADSYFIGFDDKNDAIKAASCASNRKHENSRYDVFNVKVIDVVKDEISFK